MTAPEAPGRQASGNGVVCLAVDSRDVAGYEYVKPAMLSAFDHLGIPYRLLDLAGADCDEHVWSDCACVVLGQDGLWDALGDAGRRSVLAGVRNGTGLLNFGGRSASQPRGRGAPSCSEIRTASAEHFITGTREVAENVATATPLDMHPVDPDVFESGYDCLLRSEHGDPLLAAGHVGSGRVVWFACSVRLWTREVLGHASGLDDVFWKSLVWAARKPFAIYAMPPFATALVDDCSGSYNHFRYVDVMNQYGWRPHLEVFFEDVDRVTHAETYADAAKIKQLYDEGLADFGVHGFTYDHLMWFDHPGHGPLSEAQLARNFERYDAYMKAWGITPSRYENPHFSEVSTGALPYMKERGIEYMGLALNLDTAWLDVPHKKPVFPAPAPYHHQGYYMSDFPPDPDFFILSSKLRSWDFDSPDPHPRTDFLWDHTMFWDENEDTDVDAAADVAIMQVRRGIDARFFGTILCHEQRVAVVTMRDWEWIFQRLRAGLHKYKLEYRSIEEIADYARSRYNSHLASVRVDRDKAAMECGLTGRAKVTTRLEVYDNRGKSVVCRYVDVPPFTGSVAVTA